MIIVGILVVLFAVSNRSVVILELWPLPYFIPFPFYGAVLIAAFIGFIGGSIFLFMMATRLLPAINVWEQKELLLYKAEIQYHRTKVTVLGKSR